MGKSKSHKILGTKSEFFFWLNAMKMLLVKPKFD